MPADRPNILFITSDQHRADTLGCAGHTCVRTPHLDQLANEGTRFTRAYSDCPVCIPARTTMITGRKSSTYGSPSYNAAFRIEHDRSQYLGSLMTSAGYQSALIGKRHWHTDPSFKAGFEYCSPIERCKRAQNLAATRDGGIAGHGANEMHSSLSRVPVELYSTDWIVDRGMDYLRELENDRPFFMWLSFVDPHPPLAIHEPYFSMYDHSPIPQAVFGDWTAEEDTPYQLLHHRLSYNSKPIGEDELCKTRGVYYGMISNMDEQLARIFGYLQSAGLWENTLVVYTSDHGEMLGDHHDLAKSSFLNGAANIPMIIRPPSSWQAPLGQESSAMAELADLLPTFCDIADIKHDEQVEGKSLLPLIRGENTEHKDYFFGAVDRQYCMRDGQHKYLYFPVDGKELLFAESDHDDLKNLLPNEAIAAPLRQVLIQRLEDIDSEDVKDGVLVNDGLKEYDTKIIKAQNPAGWGHPGRSLRFGGAV